MTVPTLILSIGTSLSREEGKLWLRNHVKGGGDNRVTINGGKVQEFFGSATAWFNIDGQVSKMERMGEISKTC